MRYIGLDFGDKTIGVAVSDALFLTAQGLEGIQRENPNAFKSCMKRLAEIVLEYEVSKIILGYPKNLDNTLGDRCVKTDDFAERLRKRFPKIEIILWDERFSTIGANRSLMEANINAQKRKSVIDKMASVYILQGYLDFESQKRKQEEI